MWIWITLIAIPIILIIWVIGMYNGLVGLRNRFKNAFAQIDVQLKRRYDLIPNLVETAKGYMKHERETLEAVTSARSAASDARSQAAANPGDPEAMKGLMAAEAGLTGTLGKLFALQENYPDLKANQNMLALQEELTSTENKVAFARQAYNDSVLTYNNKREMFPSSIIANMANFRPATMFEVSDEERDEIQAGVEVKF